jgi:hypothetical protein
MILKTEHRPISVKENHPNMKKLLVLVLGFGIALGTVSFSFAQDTSGTTKKEKKGKKKKADKTDEKK